MLIKDFPTKSFDPDDFTDMFYWFSRTVSYYFMQVFQKLEKECADNYFLIY